MTGAPSGPGPRSDRRVPALIVRRTSAHKGDFGFVLVVGGSRGMAGAAALAGKSALRGGAGLVRLAVPEPCLDVVAAHEPAYMTVSLDATRAGLFSLDAWPLLLKLTKRATVVALGPGIGRSPGVQALVSRIYTHLARPVVVDADALNALAARKAALASPGGLRILTPHPGEFARLTGTMPKTDPERRAATHDLANQTRAIVVLKGARTCVSNGELCYVNTTGNPGLATGGSGDVLTGLVAALVAQAYPPYDAVKLGVYLHGLAGDLAAAQRGQAALTATDLVDFLPAAFEAWRQSEAGL